MALLGTSSFDWPAEHPPEVAESGRVVPVSWRQLVVKNRLVTSSVVARRAALIEANMFDTSLQGPEDRDLWLRVAERGRVAVLDAPLTGYRSVEGSVSRHCDRCYLGMRRIISKLDERHAWNGDWMLRQKALAYVEHSSAWIYGAAGQRGKAIRMTLKSLLLYPFAYDRSEVATSFERPKRLAVNLLRLLHLKSMNEHPEPARLHHLV